MPDGNAAAQRVLAIAKTIREGFEISFLGISRNDRNSGIIDGFSYVNLRYPSSIKAWYLHLSGSEALKTIKTTRPEVVIAYNFPALGLHRVLKYCKAHKIKLVGDITEWYKPHNLIKWIDTEWRMISLNKKMDGLIVISKYLNKYYKCNKTFLMPPTVDLSKANYLEKLSEDKKTNYISLLYAGSPGRGDKDRLDILLSVIGYYPNIILDIFGITNHDFSVLFPTVTVPENVKFWGRQTHEKTIEKLCESDFSIFFRQSTRVNNAGFPTKFAEAQAVGVPVISNHFSDLDEYITIGKNGYLASNISRTSIIQVLDVVSKLSRQDIDNMHLYTISLNQFDYRNYQESLYRFIDSL